MFQQALHINSKIRKNVAKIAFPATLGTVAGRALACIFWLSAITTTLGKTIKYTTLIAATSQKYAGSITNAPNCLYHITARPGNRITPRMLRWRKKLERYASNALRCNLRLIYNRHAPRRLINTRRSPINITFQLLVANLRAFARSILYILNLILVYFISLREQQVILDSDVAQLYGVQTMRINEAVKNNPDKFPKGYIIQLDKDEWTNLKSKFSISSWGGKNKFPRAFTERGLYMLATILKSKQATQTTISIVEAFAKLREVARNLELLNTITPETIETIEPEVIENTGGLLNELLFSGSPTSAETSVEVNLGFAKIKRSVKSESNVFKKEIYDMKKMIEEIKQTIAKN